MTTPFWILALLSATSAGCIALGWKLWREIEDHALTKKNADFAWDLADRRTKAQKVRDRCYAELQVAVFGAGGAVFTLRRISENETPKANATVRRMALAARTEAERLTAISAAHHAGFFDLTKDIEAERRESEEANPR
jgi:hypothetical protein